MPSATDAATPRSTAIRGDAGRAPRDAGPSPDRPAPEVTGGAPGAEHIAPRETSHDASGAGASDMTAPAAEDAVPEKRPPLSEEAMRFLSSHRAVSIVGPTASGKTGLGIALARALKEADGVPCEIVNADAYQMYRGMDIGTAKPTPEERRAVPHHLIDVLDPDEEMSVALFQKAAREQMDGLAARGVRPILVGGSGLYARAAIDAIAFPPTDPTVRERIEREGEEIGADALFARLREQDPQAASHMDARNMRRTVRALEVIELTGAPYSATLPRYRYVIPAVQIGLDMDRATLDARIGERTRLMRERGLVEEVRRLRPRLGPTASRALGYQQVIDFLDGKTSEDEAFCEIARLTRRLARRQMGWFGRDPRIHWLDAADPGLAGRATDIARRADAGEYDQSDALADFTVHHLGSATA